MSDSILERIAQWLFAAYGEITTANGYGNTLDVSRPEDEQIDLDTMRDLSAVLCQGDPAADGRPTNAHFFWLQPFDLYVFLLGRAAGSVPVDQRINSVVADVHKRIGLEIDPDGVQARNGTYCGGLALRIEVWPPETSVHPASSATLIRIPVAIAYRVLRKDPCSQ